MAKNVTTEFSILKWLGTVLPAIGRAVYFSTKILIALVIGILIGMFCLGDPNGR